MEATAMMGLHDGQQPLFVTGFDLDDRLPAEHPLRAVKQQIDFTFARATVAPLYGRNGNVSIDPAVILKLLLLLFLDDVKSERELMRQVAYRLDYLWFLDFSLQDEIPNHSVLSKARRRWGAQVFEELFVRTVQQCVEAGLVAGEKIHMDSTLIDANASKDSVIKGAPVLIEALRRTYAEQEAKLESIEEEDAAASQDPADEDDRDDSSGGGVNKGLLSTTDPDAAIVRQSGRDSRPRYKHHRAVDDACGVITAVVTTSGDVDEATQLVPLLEQHEANTHSTATTVVADSKYGTIENFLACDKRGVRPHMTDLQAKQRGTNRRAGIFDHTCFIYDKKSDTYSCPAGQTLSRRRHHRKRNSWDYEAERGVCNACPLRAQCTRSKRGRSIKRHIEQERLDRVRGQSASARGRADRRRRKHLMEGSFATGANEHHLKRSRWRRLHRQWLQDLLIATAQNIKLLTHATRRPRAAVAAALKALQSGLLAAIQRLVGDLGPQRAPIAPLRRRTAIASAFSETAR
jgi:transposase